MRLGRAPLRRAGRREGGAAAVEFALLFPLFLMIVFGIINFGFAFNQKINLTQAAREGSRYGATLSLAASAPGNTGTVDTWLQQVQNVVVGAGGEDLAAARPGRYVCVAYINPASSPPVTRSLTLGTGAPATTQPCFADNRSDARVQVVVRSDTVLEVLLFGGTINVGSRSVTHFEAAPPS